MLGTFLHGDGAGVRRLKLVMAVLFGGWLQAVATGQSLADTTYADVAPILAQRCVICHSGQAPALGLRLDSFDAVLKGSNNGPVVRAGDPADSELIRRIKGISQPRMPFDGPPYLEPDEIQLIEDWIAQGARNAEGVPAALPTGARVRLQGTLGRGNTLDGLPLVVGPWTRIDKRPRAGDYVEVRGTVDERGTVSVERLRRR